MLKKILNKLKLDNNFIGLINKINKNIPKYVRYKKIFKKIF